MIPTLEPWQWGVGLLIAVMVGIAKTGVPGFGILVVPMMPLVFSGRLSVGALLPLLIAADVFAVAYYRRHTQWRELLKLGPWVIVGLGGGTWFLWRLGLDHGKDWLNPIIGAIVLAMLLLFFLRAKLGPRLQPTSAPGVAATGFLAGFTTLVSNAAGPVMSIYMSALGLNKNDFMGTSAWYFFLINASKFPIYLALTAANPDRPLISSGTLAFNGMMLPGIVVGALWGRRLFERIPERLFTDFVLGLAFVAAVRLLFL